MESVFEVTGEEAVAGAALRRIVEEAVDRDVPRRERVHARSAVTEDTAEALAYLVDPFGLVGEVPGVELQRASRSGGRIDHDPGSPGRDFDEDDGDEDDAGAAAG
ncbi:hypothetical protein ACIBAI_05250 [Streptomyces sp. NPDC051041]|uniref:hypothetical protein n=1 Tax=Streptomyces sp. NPDC051041 TaxID=3365640 RepID=UPI0037A87EA2